MFWSAPAGLVQHEAHGRPKQDCGVALSSATREGLQVKNPCSLERFPAGDDARYGGSIVKVKDEGRCVGTRLFGAAEVFGKARERVWRHRLQGADGLKAAGSIRSRAMKGRGGAKPGCTELVVIEATVEHEGLFGL